MRERKRIKQIKIFIVAMGPGEIGQGMAFASYAIKKGASILFAVLRKSNARFLYPRRQFRYIITPTSDGLRRAITSYEPDILVLCNSKTFNWEKSFVIFPPSPKPPTLSIDSNWLFFPKSPYPALPWVDIYCINLPQKIFRLGLKKHGGGYTIPSSKMKKIRVVGLIPSYKKLSYSLKKKIRKRYHVKKTEKLIFLYSSVERLTKPLVFEKALDAVKILREKGFPIKLIYVGDANISYLTKKYDWFIGEKSKSTDDFYKILGSADLIFQHQGLGTLAQAISARVPVIANVKDIKYEASPYHAHAWEVGPFSRYGACSMFYFSDSADLVAKEIELLLYNFKRRKKMQSSQLSLYSYLKGEKNVYREAIRLIKLSNHFKLKSRI